MSINSNKMFYKIKEQYLQSDNNDCMFVKWKYDTN